MSDAKITPTRRKDTTLDLEEGLHSGSNATSAALDGYGNFTGHNKGVLNQETNPEQKNVAHSGCSFLPYRTASL
jgi:hypothetical protein